jgi:hypothetical protein
MQQPSPIDRFCHRFIDCTGHAEHYRQRHTEIVSALANAIDQAARNSVHQQIVRSPKALKFMISYQGVLVLALDSFPEPLLHFKSHLDRAEATASLLQNENMGTRWAKITLAAIDDKAPPLSRQVYERLCDACDRATDQLALHWIEESVEELLLILYESRELHPSTWLAHSTIPCGSNNATMETTSNVDNNNNNNNGELIQQSRLYVRQTVLAETVDHERYFPKVTLPGNRGSHYKNRLTTPEATLIYRIRHRHNLDLVRQFRQMIVEALDNDESIYTWMSDEALHVSVRALKLK